MELYLLSWVEAVGKAHNGAPVKMNENKGIRVTACRADANGQLHSPVKLHLGGGPSLRTL